MQGNHAVQLDGAEAPYIGERAFGYFHLPIIAEASFRRKLKQGIEAYDATKGHDLTEGTHWREMEAAVDQLIGNSDLRRELALRYGETLAGVIADFEAGHRTTGVRPIVVDFARTESAPQASTDARDIAAFTLTNIDAV